MDMDSSVVSVRWGGVKVGKGIEEMLKIFLKFLKMKGMHASRKLEEKTILCGVETIPTHLTCK